MRYRNDGAKFPHLIHACNLTTNIFQIICHITLILFFFQFFCLNEIYFLNSLILANALIFMYVFACAMLYIISEFSRHILECCSKLPPKDAFLITIIKFIFKRNSQILRYCFNNPFIFRLFFLYGIQIMKNWHINWNCNGVCL